MTVGELLDVLQGLDRTLPIFVQDGKGGIYVPDFLYEENFDPECYDVSDFEDVSEIESAVLLTIDIG